MAKPPQATRRQSRPLLLLLLTSLLLCLRQPPPRLPPPCFPPNHDLFIHLPRWLSVAFFRHAQDLTLDLGGTADPIPFDFPNSLVRLTLIGLRIIIPPSTFVNLSSLEALNLYYIAITDSDLEMVIRGCYLLRSLDIRRCLGLKNVVIPGMGLWLENVKVVDCYGMAELSIETRSLRRLHYCGRFLSKFYFEWLWKLELENVFASCGGMGLMYGALDFKLDVLPVTNWLTVFGGFSRVKGLTLCSLSLRYIAASGDFHKFPCLRELQLLMMTMTKSNLMDICNFFRLCFPSGLEKLFIEFPRNIGSPFEKFSNDVEEQPLAGACARIYCVYGGLSVVCPSFSSLGT